MSYRQFRVSSLFFVASLATSVASCGPSGGAQTVSFVLDLEGERLNRIEFVVGHADGSFSGDDGSCEVGAAAGPGAAAVQVRVAARAAKGEDGGAALAKAVADSTSSTSTSTTTTEEPPTTTEPPVTTTFPDTTTTTMVVPTSSTTTTTTTTTAVVANVCGNGVVEAGEECDDHNVVSNDGCDANCDAEYSFSSVNSDNGELTIRIVNGKGIPPGATLAFCKFSGDVAAADFTVVTTDCGFPDGTTCDPDTDAEVTPSTTTTTTTTSTTTTTTTTTSTTTTTRSRALVGVTGLRGY